MKKLSKYNQYVKVNNNYVVYNLKENSSIIMETNNLEDLKNFLLESDDKNFKKLGFVSNIEEVNEMKKMYNKIYQDQSTLNIMLIMTYNCNCACQYCFEKNDFDKEECVDENKLNLIVNYIIEHFNTGSYEELELHYFGGEPLLKINEMLFVQKKIKQSGIKFKSNVITNGVLLNENNIKKLLSMGIDSFQITIDGDKKIHDERRPMKNGDSCYDLILKNLNAISNLSNDLSINIRINIDDNNYLSLNTIYSNLPDYIKYNSNNSIYVAPVIGQKCNSFNKMLKARSDITKNIWNTIKQSNLNIDIIPPLFYPCPYHSEKSAFYLDLYGNRYNCGGFVGDKEKIIDNILFNNQKLNSNNESNNNLNINTNKVLDSCYECSFFPVCAGGCNFESSINNENCQKKYLKEVYDEYFTKYARNV